MPSSLISGFEKNYISLDEYGGFPNLTQIQKLFLISYTFLCKVLIQNPKTPKPHYLLIILKEIYNLIIKMEDEAEGWDDFEYEDEPELITKYSEGAMGKIKGYKCYSSDEIQERQQKIIQEVIELMGLSEDDAITALKHFSWNPEKLQEQWFDNERKTRET